MPAHDGKRAAGNNQGGVGKSDELWQLNTRYFQACQPGNVSINTQQKQNHGELFVLTSKNYILQHYNQHGSRARCSGLLAALYFLRYNNIKIETINIYTRSFRYNACSRKRVLERALYSVLSIKLEEPCEQHPKSKACPYQDCKRCVTTPTQQLSNT